jgi:hypothetical protein
MAHVIALLVSRPILAAARDVKGHPPFVHLQSQLLLLFPTLIIIIMMMMIGSIALPPNAGAATAAVYPFLSSFTR